MGCARIPHRRTSLARARVALASLLALGLFAGCGNRLSAGGSGRAVPVVLPALPLSSAHPVVGLVSAAGGPGRVRVDWRAGSDDLVGARFAVFVGPARDALFATTPHDVVVADGHVVIDGVGAGPRFVGLGVRAANASADAPWTASGPVLAVHTGFVRYVDPTVAPGSGDGATPSAPTNDLVLALLDAFVAGGGSVHVARGDLGASAIPLFQGVHLLGGFAPGFALEDRDVETHATRVSGVAGQPIVRVEAGASGTTVLDGFELVGTFAVPQAVDLPGLGAEVRACRVTGTSRGFKIRGLATGPRFDAVIAGCAVSSCELEGVSVDGAVDLTIEASTFDANGNEGVDLNHLWAPSGTTVALVVRGSTFSRNGTEGLDVHLGAPVGATGTPGTFVVDVAESDFESNTLAGARVDVDYEAFPGWSADVLVRGVRARANGGAGLHFDLDAAAHASAHRVACAANGGDGFLLTSETHAGLMTLSCSALVGNLGYGARLQQGNVALIGSGLVIAGNAIGGVDSPVVPSTVHSSITWLQDAPWSGVLARDVVVANDATLPCFESAPREFATILALGTDTLTLLAPPVSSGRGATFEAADDDTPRAVTSVIGTTLSVAPAVEGLRTPARGAFFSAGSPGLEDWRLVPSSPAVGTGLAAPGAPLADCGPFARFVGGPPGRDDVIPRPWFRVADTNPAIALPIASNAPIEITFAGGDPDPVSGPGAVLAYANDGTLLGTVAFVSGAHLVVAPPPRGWVDGDRVEVHTSLRATSGVRLGQAAVLRVRTL